MTGSIDGIPVTIQCERIQGVTVAVRGLISPVLARAGFTNRNL
jgi:hypothetical protein